MDAGRKSLNHRGRGGARGKAKSLNRRGRTGRRGKCIPANGCVRSREAERWERSKSDHAVRTGPLDSRTTKVGSMAISA
jgi:hypothetical protein